MANGNAAAVAAAAASVITYIAFITVHLAPLVCISPSPNPEVLQRVVSLA